MDVPILLPAYPPARPPAIPRGTDPNPAPPSTPRAPPKPPPKAVPTDPAIFLPVNSCTPVRYRRLSKAAPHKPPETIALPIPARAPDPTFFASSFRGFCLTALTSASTSESLRRPPFISPSAMPHRPNSLWAIFLASVVPMPLSTFSCLIFSPSRVILPLITGLYRPALS